MIVKFNFDLKAWISGVEIEADSYEEAEEKLLRMDVKDLIEEGYIENSDLDSIESNITEKEVTVKTTNIKYSISDFYSDDTHFDTEEEKVNYLATLPQNVTVTIQVRDNDDIEELIKDELDLIEDIPYYVDVDSIEYKILKEN